MNAPVRKTDRTVGAALADATARLRAAGVDGPRRDARLLLAALLEEDVGVLLTAPERLLDPATAERFAAMVEARAARTPVSRILGWREFWSLPLRVNAATLDPRPESETVVEAVLARIPDRAAPLRILDLGTGGGCLLLALLHELPGAWGLGVDRSAAALATARANAADLGLVERAAFAASDWTRALAGRFDIVVCNPPYVVSSDISRLAPEVARHDPPSALDGGDDGLSAYRLLAPDVVRVLAPSGLAAVEVGAGQDAAVAALFAGAGLDCRAVVPDLAGIPRCVLATVAKSFPADGEKAVGNWAFPD